MLRNFRRRMQIRREKGGPKSLRINVREASKQVNSETSQRAVDQMKYPVLGLLEPFINKHKEVLRKKSSMGRIFTPRNLRSLRKILYGTITSEDQGFTDKAIERLAKKFADAAESKNQTIHFLDPKTNRPVHLRIDFIQPQEKYIDESSKKNPVAVMHGIHSGSTSMVKVIRKLLQKGFPVISFSYPGFSKQGGSVDYKTITKGVALIFEEIKNRFAKINIFAHSLGAGIAAKTLADAKDPQQFPEFENLVFVAPFSSSSANLESIVNKLIENYPCLDSRHRRPLLSVLKKIFQSAWDTAKNMKKASTKFDFNSLTTLYSNNDPICSIDNAMDIHNATNTKAAKSLAQFDNHGHFTTFEGQAMPLEESLYALNI